MRLLLIAGLMAAPAVADAQRGPGASYDVPAAHSGQRWEMQNGRWVGAVRAPGGYRAYRRPYVGYALPRYWVQPGFAVPFWSAYGLPQPAPGYSWYRYYDDAVLIDRQGSVHDHVEGIVWDGDVPVAPDYPSPRPRMSGVDGRWVSPDGRTVVTTGGYGATTVTVQSAPTVTTTTTTEYID